MTQLQAILNYPETDRELYQIERELAGSEERKEYAKWKKFLESAPEKLDSLEGKATSLKGAVATLEAKYEKVAETLGEFNSLDELIEGGADVSFYKKKAQVVSEQLKKIKAEINELLKTITATSEEYQKLKKQVIVAQKNFRDAKEKYEALKATKEDVRKEIEGKLEELAKSVGEETLTKYKNKRKEKIFPVLGRMVDKRCPFCSMEPPLAAVNKLTGGATIECDSCRRILFKE